MACETGVQQQARHDGVRVSTFRIIYELLDFVKQRMLDLLPPEYKEAIRGHAEIKVAFDIGKTGRVAGCQMLDGVLRPDARYRIFRKKEKFGMGKYPLSSTSRMKFRKSPDHRNVVYSLMAMKTSRLAMLWNVMCWKSCHARFKRSWY